MEALRAPIPPSIGEDLYPTTPNESNDHTYLYKEIYDLWTIHNSHVSMKPLRRKSSVTVKWCDYTSTPTERGV